QPLNGSAFSLSRHNCASESMPLRKSTASTATSTRIWGLIWIIGLLSRQARSKLAQSSALPLVATRILPQADSNSTTHSTDPAVGGANNSRNAGGAGLGGW